MKVVKTVCGIIGVIIAIFASFLSLFFIFDLFIHMRKRYADPDISRFRDDDEYDREEEDEFIRICKELSLDDDE